MTECLIGIRFNDFILMASDGNGGRSIVCMRNDVDKIYELSDKLAMGICGDSGDTVSFAEFILQNVQLYKIRNGYEMSPNAAAHFTRRQLVDTLRTRNAYHVNLLLGGMDDKSGAPSLYFMDYLGSIVSVPFAIHGYGSYVSLSVLDRKYDPNMCREDAINLMRDCIKEIQKRFVYNLSNFKVKLIDAEGISCLEDITVGK